MTTTQAERRAQGGFAGSVTLSDKYDVDTGRIYISGIQALVRLPMVQRQRDQLAGRNTGGFISGDRESPLGALDHELWRQQSTMHSPCRSPPFTFRAAGETRGAA